MARMTWDMVGDSRYRGLGPGGCPKGLSMDACEDTPRTDTSRERERAGLFVHDLVGVVPRGLASGSAAVLGRRRARKGHGGCARGRARSQGMRVWERGCPRALPRRFGA